LALSNTENEFGAKEKVTSRGAKQRYQDTIGNGQVFITTYNRTTKDCGFSASEQVRIWMEPLTVARELIQSNCDGPMITKTKLGQIVHGMINSCQEGVDSVAIVNTLLRR
jgi:hypothetical protein